MSRRERTQYSAEEKVAILRRHLLDHVPISELCDQYKLQPTVFYRWQKAVFRERRCRLRPDRAQEQLGG